MYSSYPNRKAYLKTTNLKNKLLWQSSKIGELLKLRGLDINKRIKLVRHKDACQKQFINGVEVEGNPYDWYRNDKDKFIAYQSEQHRDVFKNVDYIVSFIGENGTIARFIGIYKIEGPDNERNTNKYCYKITEVEGLMTKRTYHYRLGAFNHILASMA